MERPISFSIESSYPGGKNNLSTRWFRTLKKHKIYIDILGILPLLNKKWFYRIRKQVKFVGIPEPKLYMFESWGLQARWRVFSFEKHSAGFPLNVPFIVYPSLTQTRRFNSFDMFWTDLNWFGIHWMMNKNPELVWTLWSRKCKYIMHFTKISRRHVSKHFVSHPMGPSALWKLCIYRMNVANLISNIPNQGVKKNIIWQCTQI